MLKQQWDMWQDKDISLTFSSKYDYVFSSDDESNVKSSKAHKKKKKHKKQRERSDTDSEGEASVKKRKKSHVSKFEMPLWDVPFENEPNRVKSKNCEMCKRHLNSAMHGQFLHQTAV